MLLFLLFVVFLIKKRLWSSSFAKVCCQIWANSFYSNHPVGMECFDFFRIFLKIIFDGKFFCFLATYFGEIFWRSTWDKQTPRE
jgi:hypothetical protein